MSLGKEERLFTRKKKKIFFFSSRYNSSFVNTYYSKHDYDNNKFSITFKDEIGFLKMLLFDILKKEVEMQFEIISLDHKNLPNTP